MNPDQGIVIRRAELSDIEPICDIDRQCFPAPLAYDMETFLYYLLDRLSETWVAEEEGRIAGFAIFQMEPRGTAHFITLDVLPDHREKRIGSSLMETVHARARERGATVMVLQVAVNNAVALGFYERRGYVKKRRIRGYYEDRTDAWEMRLELPSNR